MKNLIFCSKLHLIYLFLLISVSCQGNSRKRDNFENLNDLRTNALDSSFNLDSNTQSKNLIKSIDSTKNKDILSNSTSNNVESSVFTASEVEISDPIIVFEADKVEPWGFVQFPRIMRNSKGEICVTWNLASDNINAKSKIGWKYSKDFGKTWGFRWKERPIFPGTILSNGDEIKFTSTKIASSKLILPKTYKSGYKATSKQQYKFYKSSDLPKEFNEFSILRKKKGSTSYLSENVMLNDPIGYRYELDGIFDKQAWGNIIETKNKELLKVNYPYFYEKNGIVGNSGVGIFNSKDNGKSWNLKSYIMPEAQNIKNSDYGFSEPDIIVTNNGNLLVVLRSSIGTEISPMYSSISKDGGETFSKPKPFTKSGVLPQLLLLKNGILVLSSGRPGVQLRISKDNGNTWSDAFELVKSSTIKGQSSCGYTGLLAISDNEFLIVYSNFTHKNSKNQTRKSIEVRKVKVSN